MRQLPWQQFCVSVLLLLSFGAAADDLDPDTDIRNVVERLSKAWQAGDGSAWADEFAEDADFTVWFGLRLKGREEIAFGHQMIFDNFYANTKFEMTVQDIRFIGDDVAVALLAGSVVNDGESMPEEPDAVPMAVLKRQGEAWKIVAFQNTPFAVNEFRTNGDIKRLKQLASQ